MDQVLQYIQSNVEWAPYISFGLLLLAGFNIPVSEDLLLFVSGILAAQNPEHMWPLFIGVYSGAFLSDLICYGIMGRYLGPKIFKIKMFQKMVSQEKLETISSYYEKYGVLTLVLGRFVPFGVRNALFITAGFSKMNAAKFAVSDFVACTMSCSFFFWLYLTYGESVLEIVKKGNIIIFSIFLLVLFGTIVKKKREKKQCN